MIYYVSDMIQSTQGKFAANAVRGKYAKGFPDDLVTHARAMPAAVDAAVDKEDLRFTFTQPRFRNRLISWLRQSEMH